MTPHLSPIWKARLRIIFFFLGLGLFGLLVIRLNPSTLWDYLQNLGPNFLWILAISCSWYLAYAWAWEIFLKNLSNRVKFWNIFKIKISGEAINSVTPLSWGGGDPVRIYLLKNHIPMNEGTASVVVDRSLNNLAIALFMFFGILLTLYYIPLPNSWRWGLLGTLVALIAGGLFLYLRSKEGLFEFFLDLLKTLRIKRHFSEATWQRVREIDRHIAHFYKWNKRGFLLAFLLHFLGRIGGVVEIFLAAKFLAGGISFLDSYLLASMTIVINMLFVFIPGSVGVMEGAYAGIFGLLGQNPALGASIQIVRRLRMVFWVAVGFLFLGPLRGRVVTPEGVRST